MSALNTDLYELTMAAGYFVAGKTQEVATFELTTRRLPEHRNFLIAAGLQQAVEYLRELRFQPDEIDYLRSLSQFTNSPPEFFRFLTDLRVGGRDRCPTSERSTRVRPAARRSRRRR